MKIKTRLRLKSAAFALTLALASSPALAQSEDPATGLTYALPAQPLGEMLRTIARQAGTEILIEEEAVAGRQSPALTGTYNFDQAVAAALAGTGLVAERRGGVVTIRRARAAEPAGSAGEEQITITGSRIRGARAASPLISTSREAIEAAGVSDMTGFARLIPQNFTGGQNPGVVGAGQGGQSNINNSTTLNLRGLGPDATLTLINGHRIAYDAAVQGVDIGVIPLAAIERVELIADGASALYGSDAVAGVANIILRRDFDGVQLRARIGASTDGGNVQQQYGVLTGTRWEGGGFMVAGDYSRSTAVDADDRDYTSGLDDSATLLPRQRQLSGIIAAHHRLTDNLTLEFDGQASTRESEKANVFFTTSDVFTNGLLNRPSVDSFALTPALRASLPHGWEGAVSYTHAESFTNIVSRFFLAAVETSSRLFYDNRLDNAELSAEGPVLSLPGGDIRLAIGGGYRTVSFENQVFDTTGGTSRRTRLLTETRNILFAYGELSVPLVGPGNRRPAIEALRISGAVRYERHAGIDEVVTPKLGLVYVPLPGLQLSATWGRSFKVPTLFQVNQVRTATLFAGSRFRPPPVPALPAGATVLVLGGGNPDLGAEQARNWSAGLDWRPGSVPGLRLHANYFDVDYEDRVVSPVSSALAALGNPLFAALVERAPSAARVNALVAQLPRGLDNQSGLPFDPANVAAILDTSLRNAARERVRGVDFGGDWRVELGENRLQFSLSGSYIQSERQLFEGQPLVERAGRIFNPPHWRGRLGGTWDRGSAQLGLFVNHVGGTLDDRFTPLAEIGSFTTVDFTGRFVIGGTSPFAGTELRFSLLNLFDVAPDPIANSDPAAPPFDSTNQSPVGRFVGLQVSRTW